MTEPKVAHKRKTSKFIGIGCAVGCGTIIIIIISIVGMGYYLLKDTINAFEETEKVTQQLKERLGKVEDFCPPAEQIIQPDRLDMFLTLREEMKPRVKEMDKHLSILLDKIREAESGEESFGKTWSVMKNIFGALPELADYFTYRNRKLLDRKMGLGEYYYIYVVTYYGWLQKLPSDGPDFNFASSTQDRTIKFALEDMLKNKDKKHHSESWEHGEDTLHRVRGFMRTMLVCQLKEVRKRSATNEELIAWKDILSTEINALRDMKERSPWKGGIPEQMQHLFEPFHTRIQDTYYQNVNPIEFGLNKD